LSQPSVSKIKDQSPETHSFLNALQEEGFGGDCHSDYATRIVSATDNSIYQVIPQAVLFPKNTADVLNIFKIADNADFSSLTFTARGGGTGTNGQSLNAGIVIDCSRYMTAILEINKAKKWVRVQPGVVLDQLNDALRPHGLFFGPSLSPSSRATIGGMINTDACGKGSRLYGRTSENILNLELVLSDGTSHRSESLSEAALKRHCEQSGRLGRIYQSVSKITTEKQALIAQQFPKMIRFLTGYDLAHVHENGQFDLNRLIAGSEGTLALVTEAKLKVLPIPKCRCMVVLGYPNFMEGIKDAQRLSQANPAAIETMDERLLGLAAKDVIGTDVKKCISEFNGEGAMTLVECLGDNEDELMQHVKAIHDLSNATLKKDLADPKSIAILWEMRKRAVELLTQESGPRQPVPFIEDTVVAPVHLLDYMADVRALLDSHNLSYGMYGHADVGCIHVRPSLNLQDPKDVKLVKTLSDAMVALVRKYGGVMWGEHGRGFRTDYTPEFFGDLYEDLRTIKSTFDPDDKLNPGKIVPSKRAERIPVSVEGPLKARFDQEVSLGLQADYISAFRCNGNGACFHYHQDVVMCPSYKVTGDRIHSPKGRAMLLREWLRLRSQKTPTQSDADKRFDHEVYEALHGCLNCKACTTQCPVNVDIPAHKSRFLNLYHQSYRRPLRDYLVGWMEHWVPWQHRFPRVFNALLKLPGKHLSGLVDLPRLDVSGIQTLKKLGQQQSKKKPDLYLLQDAFTSSYDAGLYPAMVNLCKAIGKTVAILPYFPSGKALHVKGFLSEFDSLANRNIKYLEKTLTPGVPIVGLDPSIVLFFRDEYSKVLGKGIHESILLPQEYLVQNLKTLNPQESTQSEPYHLFGHCTETTAAQESMTQWQSIFEKMGLTLNHHVTGCCGMA